MKKRIKFLLAAILIVIVGLLVFFSIESKSKISQDDEIKIKQTTENFIKTDFSSLRGSNDFSTVGNDKFKQYLKARNDIKKVYAELVKSDSQSKKIDYKFKYLEIARAGKYVKVDVDVSEIGLEPIVVSDGKKSKTTHSGTSNHSILYLAKIGNEFKVMSARRDTQADLIDDEFNANKELGFEDGFEDNDDLTSKNLKKLMDRMEERKKKIVEYYKKNK